MARMPGNWLLRLARRWLDEVTVTRVLEPLVADWQADVAAAPPTARPQAWARGACAAGTTLVLLAGRAAATGATAPVPLRVVLGCLAVALTVWATLAGTHAVLPWLTGGSPTPDMSLGRAAVPMQGAVAAYLARASFGGRLGAFLRLAVLQCAAVAMADGLAWTALCALWIPNGAGVVVARGLGAMTPLARAWFFAVVLVVALGRVGGDATVVAMLACWSVSFCAVASITAAMRPATLAADEE